MAKLLIQLLIILATVEIALCYHRKHTSHRDIRGKCECHCKPRKRVVGGYVVKDKDKFPFMVGLVNEHFCSGILVSPRHVLTAAHCIELFVPISKTRVILGSINLKEPKKVMYAEKAIVHENYHNMSVENDIGIIVMKERVDFTRSLRSCCLPLDWTESYEGNKVTLVGYGISSDIKEKADGKLRSVALHIVPLDKCQDRYSNKNISDFDSQLCAGYHKGGKDACDGDSGGPIVLLRKGVYVTVGIVSWGRGCGLPGNPGVYTSLNKYLNWIKNETQGECICQEWD